MEVEETRLRTDGRVEANLRYELMPTICATELLHRTCSHGTHGHDGAGDEFVMRIPPQHDYFPSSGTAEFNIRTEGRITFHNSDGPIERGNVIVWRRNLEDIHENGLNMTVATDATSVLSHTVRTVGRSALIAFGLVALALLLLYAEGKRRLHRSHREREPV